MILINSNDLTPELKELDEAIHAMANTISLWWPEVERALQRQNGEFFEAEQDLRTALVRWKSASDKFRASISYSPSEQQSGIVLTKHKLTEREAEIQHEQSQAQRLK